MKTITDTTESTYLGTKLPSDRCRQFGIRAAARGVSKSALLKSLVLDFIAAEPTPPTPPAGPKKEGRAA